MFEEVVDRNAFMSLLVTRVVYALNWYNTASIFSLMAVGFGQGVGGLGALTSSFYLGIGIFQIPGGLLAARIGPKLTAVLGTLISSMAVVLSGVVPQFDAVIITRFLVGAGMAFVFAPGIILITQYFRRGAEGLAVGLYNSAFQTGGVIGLFGWAVLATIIGWRPSLVLSGSLGVLTAIMLFATVPSESASRQRLMMSQLTGVLLNRRLLLLGAVASGLSVGSTLVSGFLVYYLVKDLEVAPATAGAIGALVFLVPIFTSVIGGRVYDRRRDFRLIVALSGSISGLATMAAGFGGVYGPIAASILGGSLSGLGFTMVVSAAREADVPGPEYRTLSVAWVNSLLLTTSFIPPILFSFLAETLGYTTAWVGGGLLAFLLTLPIVFIKNTSTR
jgi:MFS family permease